LDVDILPGEKYSCVPTARFQTLSAWHSGDAIASPCGKKSREQSHTTLPLTQRSDTRFLVLVHHLLGWILHAPSYRIDSQSEWSACVVPSWMRCCDPQGREAASSDDSGHVDLLLVRRMIVRWRCRPGWILPHG
jgi:hypothetical protein